MNNRSILPRLFAVAVAGLILAMAAHASAAPPADGALYFVNLTKRATAVSVDSESPIPANTNEVQSVLVTAGPHELHVDVDGWPPQTLKVDFDRDHVAQDETGQTVWCVVAVVDAQPSLRVVPFEPGVCSKLVARGVFPVSAEAHFSGSNGNLYFINEIAPSVDLAIDSEAQGPIESRQVFGRVITPGEHDLHLAIGASRSVDVHLNFDARNVGHDDKGRQYWCVGAAPRKDGSPAVFEINAQACTDLVGSGAPTSAH